MAVQMVLEGCLAKLLHGGYVSFGVACIAGPLDTNLIGGSEIGNLCDAVSVLPC